mgnify:CR=1 FL=1
MTLAAALEEILPAPSQKRFGELVLSRLADNSFEARHQADQETGDPLEDIDSLVELRELAKFDAENEFRSLKTAPTLKSGWVIRSSDAADFLDKLDALYPGVFATWIAYRDGDHEPTALRSTLARQTGLYRRFLGRADKAPNRKLTLS